MGALQKIREAGFSVLLIEDSIEISPASALTLPQREFLKSNKAEIVDELIFELSRVSILNWLTSIGEDDPKIIADTMERCRTDHDALAYFINRANEAPPIA